MMRAQMNCENDQEMIRLAFRVLDKKGEGNIKSSSFKHLMMNIGLCETVTVFRCYKMFPFHFQTADTYFQVQTEF